MGHSGIDARCVNGDGAALVATVRRGAVRSSRPARVAASSWEHVEVALAPGGSGDDGETAGAVEFEVVSSLVLSLGGDFRAAIASRVRAQCAESGSLGVHDDTSDAEPTAVALGSWRPCRAGVELVFGEEVSTDGGVDLPERIVSYSLRHDFLIAQEADLPDGLAQEYSLCRSASITSSRSADAPPGDSLLNRMLVDASALCADGSAGLLVDPGGPSLDSRARAAHTPLPVGLIEEGADSDSDDALPDLPPPRTVQDSAGGAFGHGCSKPLQQSVPATVPSCVTSYEVATNTRNAAHVPSMSHEEYPDDFECEEDIGDTSSSDDREQLS